MSLATTAREIDAVQEDYEMQRKRRMPKSNIIVVSLDLSPGQGVIQVAGAYKAYVCLPDPTAAKSVALEEGEVLHYVPAIQGRRKKRKGETEKPPFVEISPAGFIVQPSGAPTMNATGVTRVIHRSIVWIHQLTRRGPLNPFGGLQGYVMNDEGNAWIPKRGTGRNGAEVMYYLEDVQAWAQEYAPPTEEAQSQLEEPSPALYSLFKLLGEWEQREKGYVTRSRVIDTAKLMTRYPEYTELAPYHSLEELASLLAGKQEYTSEQLKEKFGLEDRITDSDYNRLMYVAQQENWGRPPRMQINTAAYRRKPRSFTVK